MPADLQRLFAHLIWADARLLQALRHATDSPAEALREFGHGLGADEAWLARIEGRAARAAVWPNLPFAQLEALADMVHEGYRRLLATLDDPGLARTVGYTNSAGQRFENTVGDILLHVAMHAQYHRGKVNLLLRQAGLEPAPVDYIAYIRGAPAARTSPPSSRAE